MNLTVLFSLILSCCLLSSACAQADKTLLAHWDFNDGSGDVLHDRSGNGHDAQITGATWVEGKHGGALQFDGVDDVVSLPQSKELNLSGDATISIWFKTAPTKELARDQLLFGDGASRTINRNLSIVIDQGKLSIVNGNGLASDSISPTTEFAGAWTHLAIVFEFPTAFVYINGNLVEVREMSVPLSPTEGAGRFIGGWWAGHLKGEIDDLKIYSRALAENEVLAEFDPGAPAAKPVGSITPKLSISRKKVELQVSCRNLTQQQLTQSKTWVELFSHNDLSKKRTPIYRGDVALTPTRPGSERFAGAVTVDLKDAPYGTYDASVSLQDASGKAVAALGVAAVYFDQPPVWWGNRLGITDKVPPPFTPVVAKKDAKGVSIGVTQREYRIDAADLFTQIIARDVPILAAPARLLAKVDGRDVVWKAGELKVDSTAADAVVYSQSLNGGGVRVSAKTSIEYDGFAKLQLDLQSSSPVQLNQLVIEIPIKADSAKYLFAWAENVKSSGARPDKIELAFVPILWLGNDEHGLSWFCETDQNWKLKQASDAIHVETAGDKAIVRLTLVNRESRLIPGKPLTYTFAWQATPLRPVTKDCWDYRITSTPNYGFDYDLLTRDLKGEEAGKWLKENGFRTLLACNWTDVLAYPWPIGKEKQLKDLVQLCHKNGMKFIPYLGYQINTLAPEFRSLRDEVVRLPLMQNPDKYPGMIESQTVATVTLSSVWQDALVYYVDKMMRDYDIDGIYLDSTCMPFGCTNALSGDGYVDEAGNRRPTYPVFAVRSTFKRLYNVVKQYKPDGYVDNHVYDCMNSAALAFSTSYWNGEQLSASANDVTQSLPVDRFRAEMMGVNWGVPADFLYYKLGDFTKAHAISLLHDVGVRSNDLPQKELNSSIWKLTDAFGRSDAKFLPYWKNAGVVTATPEGTYASLYVHPKNGVLAIVSNLKPAKTTVSVQLKVEALFPQTKSLTAIDGLTGKAVAIDGGKLDLDLEPMAWQYIWIKAISSQSR